MPRGNDSRAAAAEFRGQYGVMGNAEDLIEANRAAYDAELRTTSLKGRTDVDLDLDKVQDQVEGGNVLDAAVRGDRIVAVVETESGHTYKQVLPAKGIVKGAREARAIDEDPNVAVAQGEQSAKLMLAKARAEAERIIEEAVQEAQKEAAKIAAKAHEERDKAAKAAAKTAADDDKPTRGANAEKGDASPAEKASAREQGKKD